MSDDDANPKRADRERVRRYYAGGAEAKRLDGDDGWFERERTLSLILEQLDRPSRILDIGGGTGVYARALADAGHEVTLVDLSPELIEVAREQHGEHLERILCADIADFQAEEPFDAVVCLGPGYHVGSSSEFEEMCAHTTAFTRGGGHIFLSFIPRLTGVAGLVARAASHREQVLPGTLTEVLATGVFRNDSEAGFSEAYFAQPAEVRASFEALGVETLELCSVRGFAAYYGSALRELRDENEALYREVLQLTRETASLPEVVASCWHALYIGQKPLG